mmetsp:Transcript_26944/g.55543  ORF Transcript_26944/g.55543 Transcript_26944/m.55543 type:complete len:285 (-) Transcript_26944:1469-2323(-)
MNNSTTTPFVYHAHLNPLHHLHHQSATALHRSSNLWLHRKRRTSMLQLLLLYLHLLLLVMLRLTRRPHIQRHQVITKLLHLQLPIRFLIIDQIGLELRGNVNDIPQCILKDIHPIRQINDAIFQFSHSRGVYSPEGISAKSFLFGLESIENFNDGIHIDSLFGLNGFVVGRESKRGTSVDGFGMGIQQSQYRGGRACSRLTGVMDGEFLLIVFRGGSSGVDLKEDGECVFGHALFACQVEWETSVVILALGGFGSEADEGFDDLIGGGFGAGVVEGHAAVVVFG